MVVTSHCVAQIVYRLEKCHRLPSELSLFLISDQIGRHCCKDSSIFIEFLDKFLDSLRLGRRVAVCCHPWVVLLQPGNQCRKCFAFIFSQLKLFLQILGSTLKASIHSPSLILHVCQGSHHDFT